MPAEARTRFFDATLLEEVIVVSTRGDVRVLLHPVPTVTTVRVDVEVRATSETALNSLATNMNLSQKVLRVDSTWDEAAGKLLGRGSSCKGGWDRNW